MNEVIKYKTKQESIKAYKEYIDKHIANVKKALDLYGKKLCEKLDIDFELLKYVVEYHDKSKYREEEFEGYRLYFYESEEDQKEWPFEEEINRRFNDAWEHHVLFNPHHPEYWVFEENGEYGIHDMGLINLAEMLLDWAAMSIESDSSVYKYWTEGKGKDKPLTNKDIEVINNCIDIFK